MLKFNLRNEADKIVKASKIKVSKYTNMPKLYTHKFLTVLDYEGLLPKGYMTRVNNGHIKYETALRMVQKLQSESNYYMMSKEVAPLHHVLVLIEQHDLRYSVFVDYGVEDGSAVIAEFNSYELAKEYFDFHCDPTCSFIQDNNKEYEETSCDYTYSSSDDDDYSPNTPWNAPGMSMSDFIR